MPKKQSELTVATALGDDDEFMLLQAGQNKSIPANAFSLPMNYIAGLITSNGTDTDHDIDIAAGVARSADNVANMTLAAVLTKQIDAAWAVGDDQGGLDAGSVAVDTLYAIWLIKRPDTGVVDALFSTSFSAPTMPADYTKKRLIAAVLTDGSSNILAYTQTGDRFAWVAQIIVFDDTTLTSGAWETGTVPIPPNASLIGHGEMNFTTPFVTLANLSIRPTIPAAGARVIVTSTRSGATIQTVTGDLLNMEVDINSQFDYKVTWVGSPGAETLQVRCYGFDMNTRRNP